MSGTPSKASSSRRRSPGRGHAPIAAWCVSDKGPSTRSDSVRASGGRGPTARPTMAAVLNGTPSPQTSRSARGHVVGGHPRRLVRRRARGGTTRGALARRWSRMGDDSRAGVRDRCNGEGFHRRRGPHRGPRPHAGCARRLVDQLRCRVRQRLTPLGVFRRRSSTRQLDLCSRRAPALLLIVSTKRKLDRP